MSKSLAICSGSTVFSATTVSSPATLSNTSGCVAVSTSSKMSLAGVYTLPDSDTTSDARVVGSKLPRDIKPPPATRPRIAAGPRTLSPSFMAFIISSPRIAASVGSSSHSVIPSVADASKACFTPASGDTFKILPREIALSAAEANVIFSAANAASSGVPPRLTTSSYVPVPSRAPPVRPPNTADPRKVNLATVAGVNLRAFPAMLIYLPAPKAGIIDTANDGEASPTLYTHQSALANNSGLSQTEACSSVGGAYFFVASSQNLDVVLPTSIRVSEPVRVPRYCNAVPTASSVRMVP